MVKQFLGKFSIRKRIILFYAVSMLVVAGMTYCLFRIASVSVMEQTLADYLVSAVNANTNKLSILSKKEAKKQRSWETDDVFENYKDGVLQVDDDFLDILNDVESALYTEDGELLYGNNPLSREMEGEEFLGERLYETKIGKERYFVYDKGIEVEGGEGLWIRGVVPLVQTRRQLSRITKSFFLFFPLIIFIVLGGSFVAAEGILQPIRRMEKTATSIMDGDDLNLRIDPGSNNDELFHLANTFNAMFERLEQAFLREKQFTSDASHELRTPLAVILTQTEFSLAKERTTVEYEMAMKSIRRQAGRMKRLVEALLGLSRLHQPKNYYEMKEVDLSAVTTMVCEDMKRISRNNITINTDICPGAMIWGSRDLLERMLSNLLDNADKYGKENGHTWVTLSMSGGTIVLIIKDDGQGIKKDAQGKIFDRFYREDQARTSTGGYGLGLSLVAEIVRLHSGTIAVESQPGEGSSFVITMKALK